MENNKCKKCGKELTLGNKNKICKNCEIKKNEIKNKIFAGLSGVALLGLSLFFKSKGEENID